MRPVPTPRVSLRRWEEMDRHWPDPDPFKYSWR
jgi:hypothetical protein